MSDQEPREPEAVAVPAPEADLPPVAEPAPAEPTPVVGPAEATADHPAGTARPLHAAPAPIGEERPEVLVGAAFGGGLVAAILLRGLARRKHR
ncbi:MAG TPA: hypothetical protein VFT50_00130 [Baekduia sp.]|nr:hypothetical protein [Baekduia sp.]